MIDSCFEVYMLGNCFARMLFSEELREVDIFALVVGYNLAVALRFRPAINDDIPIRIRFRLVVSASSITRSELSTRVANLSIKRYGYRQDDDEKSNKDKEDETEKNH